MCIIRCQIYWICKSLMQLTKESFQFANRYKNHVKGTWYTTSNMFANIHGKQFTILNLGQWNTQTSSPYSYLTSQSANSNRNLARDLGFIWVELAGCNPLILSTNKTDCGQHDTWMLSHFGAISDTSFNLFDTYWKDKCLLLWKNKYLINTVVHAVANVPNSKTRSQM